MGIRFGRFSDSYKDASNYQSWEAALSYFERAEYEDSFKSFFYYLRDIKDDNVQWAQEDGGVRFGILQGSKKIEGFANARQFKAESKIVYASELTVGLLRRLVEANYVMDYCRYALDDANNLVIKFETSTLDGSPYKLYYALKEMALHADKQDDLLADEFPGILTPLETGVKKESSVEVKEAKFGFMQTEIAGVFEEIDKNRLNVEKHPVGIAYLLLDLIYKLDYLTKPEGFLMESLEKAHHAFFAGDGKSILQKSVIMRKELQKILDRPKDLAFNEFYDTVCTFGLTVSKGHDALVSIIEKELAEARRWEEQGQPRVALSVMGYIPGYCLFNYALPKPDRSFLDLYYRIMESAYFESLGYENRYLDPKTGIFDQKGIKAAIRSIAEMHAVRYQKLSPAYGMLRFDNPVGFAKSYFLMLKGLDLTEK